ncbi:unnamed protein product [Vicia faba]|uniref:Uncharacterized protein n=1 Tax=Vicia faba TaxID=3906 RepID=A0AAV1B5X4_VICFA|nr:unnamed protein product [Vicia faba]
MGRKPNASNDDKEICSYKGLDVQVEAEKTVDSMKIDLFVILPKLENKLNLICKRHWQLVCCICLWQLICAGHFLDELVLEFYKSGSGCITHGKLGEILGMGRKVNSNQSHGDYLNQR